MLCGATLQLPGDYFIRQNRSHEQNSPNSVNQVIHFLRDSEYFHTKSYLTQNTFFSNDLFNVHIYLSGTILKTQLKQTCLRSYRVISRIHNYLQDSVVDGKVNTERLRPAYFINS
ncbi:hypothetical protein ILUMI_16405 [Ignelater luminosus]|uniref:Uncharacterized protein n=1 Tax=Ignelater luminosus TaxID=2038154 RepID=A0A8K0G8Z4_IGNLU|nr:hypothetical protein ILUMI_16405 [Ignelater luminosus]